MAEIYNILKTSSYSIRQDSKLLAVMPGDCPPGVTLVAASPVFKRGTYAGVRKRIVGNSAIATVTGSNEVTLMYEGNPTYYGDDSLEFMLEYSDGTKGLKVVEIDIIKSYYNTKNLRSNYIECYLPQGSDTVTLTLTPDISANEVPTRMTMSVSDDGLSTEKDIKIFDNNISHNSSLFIEENNSILDGKSNNKAVLSGNGLAINQIESSKITFTRNLPFDRECYAVVRFKDYLKLSDGSQVKAEETFNIIFHGRAIGEIATSNVISVPPYSKPTTPNFRYTSVKYPEIPYNQNMKYINEFNEGDLLKNTQAHKERDKYGNRTIRVGENVPAGAVNLAYYYNTVASLNDTVSIQETNTNVVSTKFAEHWIYKKGLPAKDEDEFSTEYEFRGEPGTPFEGYYGTLKREYVIWEETLDVDREPEFKTVFEEYRGLTTDRAPLMKKYNDGNKSGTLELSFQIATPLDFLKDKEYIFTNKGFYPRNFLVQARYDGIVTKNIILYNGYAKYSGPVKKKDGLSNIDPEQDKELLLYPDENGTLYDLQGNNLIDDELFYITDKFKDNTPLYFKYKLKYRVYNTSEKDQYGNYVMEGVKLVTETGANIPESFKYKVFLKETQWKDVFDAYLYTSFVPSPAMPVYAMYNGLARDAYVAATNISPLNIKNGILEKISVLQAMDTDEYTVTTHQGLVQQSIIKMNNYEVIYDNRAKIKFQYIISAGGVKTPPINAEIINKRYAVSSEMSKFKDDSMIISESDFTGYLTAKEIMLKYAGEPHRKAIEKAKIFKVGFYFGDTTYTTRNSDKVIMYTDPDGTGLIYAKTYCDTGMPNNDGQNRNNLKLDPDSIYKEANGRIFKGFAVKCRNVNQIVLAAPDENDPLKGWFPKIRYSYFNKVYEKTGSSGNNRTQIIYSVPEFFNQVYGAYGAPYKDIFDEIPKYIGYNSVRVKHYPLYIKLNSAGDPINIKARKMLADGTTKNLVIESFNFEHGYITFEENISENDNVFIDYTYEERYYHYKGYFPKTAGQPDTNRKMINLNINPSQYSTYTDTENEVKENQQVYNLFNKTIYFFLRPMRTINQETGAITDNKFTLYHKFNSQESEGPFDLLIGRIFVRHNTSQKSTYIIDTRRRGGGVIEEMADKLRSELEPDSDYYLDIGTLDGKPYQENSVVVIRLDKRILTVNGGRFSEEEVKAAVQKWAAFGMYPIIQYVDIIPEDKMPHNTIKVNKHISNQLRYNPYINVSIVDV